MLIVISPAKTLDFQSPLVTQHYSQPELLTHSEALIESCRSLTPAQLASLMKISDKLAGLNAARFSEWHPHFTPQNARQAVLAFKGDVYLGLQAEKFNEADFEFAQRHLRILSGLYGVLRPLDLIQPYRLEMGTALHNARGKNLYAFWGDIITSHLNKALAEQHSDTLINLASDEYFKAVKPTSLNATVITPVFLDYKNGDYKVISFYAKKARGLMSHFIIKHNLTNLEQLKAFDSEGYRFDRQGSTTTELRFKRIKS